MILISLLSLSFKNVFAASLSYAFKKERKKETSLGYKSQLSEKETWKSFYLSPARL